jgi:hypothetical protein
MLGAYNIYYYLSSLSKALKGGEKDAFPFIWFRAVLATHRGQRDALPYWRGLRLR